MNTDIKDELVAELQNHVIQFSQWFNEAAARVDMGIRLDADEVVENLRTSGRTKLRQLAGALAEYSVHKEQVQTAVGVIAETLANPGSSGIVLGALQSGKTGTAFMTLFAAPVHYLKSRMSYVPLFMTTNQNSHLMQTQNAMRGFFNLYGDIKIISNGVTHSLIDYYAQAGNDLTEVDDDTNETSLHDYTAALVDGLYPGTDIVDTVVQGMTVKRVPGEISKKIRNHCRRARELGQAIMLIVDEPQFGASNTISRNGKETQCLLSRAFAEINEEFFSPETPDFMVGLSATPFDTANLDNLWLVKQRLNNSYVGPNAFGGEPIDPTATTQPPRVLSFKEISSGKGLEWFEEMPYLMGSTRRPSRATFKALKVAEDGTKSEMNPLEMRKKASDLLRLLLDGTLMKRQEKDKPEHPFGALVRIANNRRTTEDVLGAMGLDGPDSPYNVIRFYDSDGDVKPLIWAKTRKDPRPYIVVTVGKGRMGDAFPGSTVMGVDLTHTATDANALLQGVFGRMCGYGKNNPLVVVSNSSKDLLVQYEDNLGATEDFKLSRHVKKSTLTRGRNQRESYFMITDEMIDSDHENSPLRAFRSEVIAYLEKQKSAQETTNAFVPRRDNQFVNLPEMMERHGIIEYIAENSMRLDPELRTPARIVKVGEVSRYKQRDGSMAEIAYTLNEAGECKTLVTKVDYSSSDSAHRTSRSLGRALSEGLSDRGKVKRDPLPHMSRGRRENGILPVITVKKVDGAGRPVSGDKLGRFVFDGFIFHLEEKVHRFRPAVNLTALVHGHAFSSAMTDQEKGEQLGQYISDQMNGKRERSFMEALGTPEVQRVLSSMYDPMTHIYDPEDRIIWIRSLETGEIDNPHGPAEIDMTDFARIKTRTVDASLRVSVDIMDIEEDMDEEIELEGAEDEMEAAYRM